jgi:Uma2 family endonuclease
MSMVPRYTTTDLEGFPTIDGVRYEIIDGDLYVSKQPDWHHQYTGGEVFAALRSWSLQSGAGIAIQAPGIIFAEDDNVAPDIVWIARDRLAGLFDEAGHLRSAPTLVVEILSPGAENERRDRDTKVKLYSRQGVQEYWIVDWRQQTIQVYRREQAQLRLQVTLLGQDVLTSPLFPDFVCPLPGLWAPPY